MVGGKHIMKKIKTSGKNLKIIKRVNRVSTEPKLFQTSDQVPNQISVKDQHHLKF